MSGTAWIALTGVGAVEAVLVMCTWAMCRAAARRPIVIPAAPMNEQSA